MQQSWRKDGDKLTFIIATDGDAQEEEVLIGDVNVFLSLSDPECAEEGCDAAAGSESRSLITKSTEAEVVVGEVEIMIAEETRRGKGNGKVVLAGLLRYLVGCEKQLLSEFGEWTFGGQNGGTSSGKEQEIVGKMERAEWEGDQACAVSRLRLGYLRARIRYENLASRGLFEGMGFLQVGETNYFGEVELRLGAERLRERYGMDTLRS